MKVPKPCEIIVMYSWPEHGKWQSVQIGRLVRPRGREKGSTPRGVIQTICNYISGREGPWSEHEKNEGLA